LGAVVKNSWPTLYNLRLDPFERMGFGPNESFMSFQNYYGQEFWRFVFMQEEVAKLAKTAIDYPPLQAGASFNLDAVKKQIKEAQAAHAK
jgi:arylsulfatase